MKLFLLGIFLISSNLSANSNVFDRPFFMISPTSRTQTLIDQAIIEAFQSKLKNDLCSVFTSERSLKNTLGISLNTAEQIYPNCPRNEAPDSGSSKLYPKQYFIGFDNEYDLDINSWTFRNNKTYIFASDRLTQEDFKKIIIHEMAISIDAKMNMNYRDYMDIEKFHPQDETLTLSDIISNLSTEEERVKRAFNTIRSNSIGYTFSAMRAFNVEAIVLNKNENSAKDHNLCAKTFAKIYSLFENKLNNYKVASQKSDSVENVLSLLDNLGPKDPAKLREELRVILDENFHVERPSKMSFCQYMATPKFTNVKRLALLSSGPRPRIVGGWRFSREGIVIKKINDDIKEQLLKQQE